MSHMNSGKERIKNALLFLGTSMTGVALIGSLFQPRGDGRVDSTQTQIPDGSRITLTATEAANYLAYGRFPEVDQYDDQFWAAVNQAIESWISEKGGLPLDRDTIFRQIFDDVRAIATIESHGNASAKNEGSGARGLMQLIPQVGLDLNEGENPDVLFDVHFNIYRGTWYYFVLWEQSYEEMGRLSDLEAVSRVAAGRYYKGGKNVPVDESIWSGDVSYYVGKFAAVKSSSR